MKALAAIRGSVGHGNIGGMELISHVVFKGLMKLGVELEVLTSCKSSSQTEIIVEFIDGVKYLYLPTTQPSKYCIEFHREIKAYYEHIKKDISVIFSVSGAGSSLTKNAEKVPTVAWWHGTFLEEELDKVYKYQFIDGNSLSAFNVERLVVSTILPRLFGGVLEDYQAFDYHVCISTYMQEILKCYGIEPARISLILNGINEQFLKNLESLNPDKNSYKAEFGLSTSKIVLGLVGRMGEAKGEKLIKSLIDKLPAEKFSFFFVGAKIDVNDIEARGFEVKNISLPHGEMGKAFKAMDIFVNPTLRLSGLDMTVLEAYLSGTDVVVSNLPQYKGFADELGLKLKFFDVGDANSLEAAIKSPVKNEFKPEQLEKFSEDKMILSFYSLLENVRKK